MIRCEQFSWTFADAPAAALRDITLPIGRGEFVAVAGPSGSGKTTLALAMCGLLIGRYAGEARGSVQVDDRDVATTPLHEISETIGLVQQNPETHFATLAVSDEIAFGMENRCLAREEIRRCSDEVMQLLSITHLRERSLTTLSGGEKQRVAVASVVAGKPAVLVLDEPTASLDPEASRALFAALADLCRRTELTVVIIEHKLAQLLPLKPRLICLEAGRVVLDAPDGARVEACPAWLAGPGPISEVAPAAAVNAPDFTRAEPLVDVSELTVKVDGNTILDKVSLKVHSGEVLAILGPNGGGKSTLLHCLLGLLTPTHGTIRVCDVAVSPAAVSRLAERVGMVFQNADHQLVADTVWSEALFGAHNLNLLEQTTEQEAARLLARAGLQDRTEDHPHRLSWGEKRRLNLISAMLHNPRLLLLDEPFAGQDWENVRFLLETIRRVLDRPPDQRRPQRRGACLMVTHDPRIVQRGCTRVLFVSQGRIAVDVPVSQAFERLSELGYKAYVP
ncbi:MAG: ATP-binding cassette domain-containing protein [Phycisphaerae bacterium]|nr:ATP-binding cassette domain-containing protein [Phycisphaerae bacterium]